ncbi:Polyketide cyclase / dehydrase and lipid transport [Actinomadura meyerae]|jgi:carbon monoxide dehydrogenase subunit G|uniref:Polyketide cyclase / dehydrase and lipid transport n=1 Tax=Actinomadura meyerae TaxID=240840 RepID=A0A239FK68_9ACTN|nr:SRPBCC family protein [Actinomadura meyerae]SNS57151.1 Polyketide cyclase / dehydrase and lipid transport [Actinomadura meyerae]
MSRVAVHAEAVSAAPPERVFEILVDWPRHADWMPFTTAEGGTKPGDEIRARTGVGPVGFVDTMVITDWQDGRRVAVRHTGRVVRGEAWFKVVPEGTGSRVVWAERIDLPLGPLGRAGWLVAGPVVKAFLGLGLRRLAVLSEA